MRTELRALLVATLMAAQLATPGHAPASSRPQSKNQEPKSQQEITKEVRHQLVMLPYYSVFDNLAYSVDPNGVVTLSGEVRQPWLKSDAEHAVKHIAGVTQVIDNVKVLPLSPMDNRIRAAEYR